VIEQGEDIAELQARIKAADLASFGGNSKPSRPLTPNGAQRAFDFQ
jgi:hypothetical protein